MAAYAALLSLAQTTDMDRNHGKDLFSFDAKTRLRSIHAYVLFLMSFLEDFPDRASRWESKIRCVAHEIEDIIDLFMWQNMQSNYIRMNPSIVELEDLLKGVTEILGSIAGETMEDRPVAASSSSRLVPGHDGTSSSSSSSRLAAPTCKVAVIGLDNDILAIKDRLCGQSSKLQVIPIVGMGGLGKTTLARTIYDDPLTMEYFDIRVWVTVSQDYSEKSFRKILLSVLDSMKLLEDQTVPRDEIHESELSVTIFQNLKNRRYVIVMDDVWGTEVWDDVRSVFPDDRNGSRIMLTSRLLDVATYPDPYSPIHEMRFMNDSQSWDLLKLKVFTNRDVPQELEDVGKEIAKSCIGLPLAIVLVAGFLSAVKQTRAAWAEISKSVNSVVGSELDRILSLSYTRLPHHLRPCFLFIGAFPEDAKIRASKLIRLWIAEGFLKHQNESMEEEAEKYLEDLVNRNLVMVTSRKRDGKIKSCSLHDMTRDSCIKIAIHERFLHVMDGRVGMKNERRVIVRHPDFDQMWDSNPRTILCLVLVRFPSLQIMVRSFRLLKVLDVETFMSNEHRPPSQVFELFHLRYLTFGFAFTIPSSISNLVNLQTLVIRYFYQSWRSGKDNLPLEIWKMPQLRHLVLGDLYMLPHPPYRSNLPLESLQTLSGISNLVWNDKILQMIPNVKKLKLAYGINQEYHLHQLKYLDRLEYLTIIGKHEFSWRVQNPTFPRTLKKLSLSGGGYPWEKMRIIGSLPNLQVLQLLYKACAGNTWNTADEEFPQLIYLQIVDCDPQQWITQSSPFPRLKCLVLEWCWDLEEIPEGIGEIPSLELIEVYRCSKSVDESVKQIKEYQESYENYDLQVRITPRSSEDVDLTTPDKKKSKVKRFHVILEKMRVLRRRVL